MEHIGFVISTNSEGVFRDLRMKFNDIYCSINFEYYVSKGVNYFVSCDLVETINKNKIEQVYDVNDELDLKRKDALKLN